MDGLSKIIDEVVWDTIQKAADLDPGDRRRKGWLRQGALSKILTAVEEDRTKSTLLNGPREPL